MLPVFSVHSFWTLTQFELLTHRPAISTYQRSNYFEQLNSPFNIQKNYTIANTTGEVEKYNHYPSIESFYS